MGNSDENIMCMRESYSFFMPPYEALTFQGVVMFPIKHNGRAHAPVGREE